MSSPAPTPMRARPPAGGREGAPASGGGGDGGRRRLGLSRGRRRRGGLGGGVAQLLARLLAEPLDFGADAGGQPLLRVQVQGVKRQGLLRPVGVEVGVADIEQQAGHRLYLVGGQELTHGAVEVLGVVAALRLLHVGREVLAGGEGGGGAQEQQGGDGAAAT